MPTVESRAYPCSSNVKMLPLFCGSLSQRSVKKKKSGNSNCLSKILFILKIKKNLLPTHSPSLGWDLTVKPVAGFDLPVSCLRHTHRILLQTRTSLFVPFQSSYYLPLAVPEPEAKALQSRDVLSTSSKHPQPCLCFLRVVAPAGRSWKATSRHCLSLRGGRRLALGWDKLDSVASRWFGSVNIYAVAQDGFSASPSSMRGSHHLFHRPFMTLSLWLVISPHCVYSFSTSSFPAIRPLPLLLDTECYPIKDSCLRSSYPNSFGCFYSI